MVLDQFIIVVSECLFTIGGVFFLFARKFFYMSIIISIVKFILVAAMCIKMQVQLLLKC